MKNENISRCAGGANPFAKRAWRQAPVATFRSRIKRNPWRLPATAEYLRALREADEAVFQAILRGVAVRHTARTVKG